MSRFTTVAKTLSNPIPYIIDDQSKFNTNHLKNWPIQFRSCNCHLYFPPFAPVDIFSVAAWESRAASSKGNGEEFAMVRYYADADGSVVAF